MDKAEEVKHLKSYAPWAEADTAFFPVAADTFGRERGRFKAQLFSHYAKRRSFCGAFLTAALQCIHVQHRPPGAAAFLPTTLVVRHCILHQARNGLDCDDAKRLLNDDDK